MAAVPPSRIAVAAAVAGFALLAVAWAVSNPVFAAPDEPITVVKTVATGYGQFRGDPHGPLTGRRNPRAQAWFEQAVRRFELPERYVPARPTPCFAFFANRTADCDRDPRSTGDRRVAAESPQGSYEPFLYAPAGVAMRAADDLDTAVRVGRLTNAGLSLGFVAAALALGASGGGPARAVRLAGVTMATSPQLVFLSATVSTNGVEGAAAVCTWAAALRLASPDRSPGVTRAAWWAVGVAGTALALSRLLDPAYLAVIAAAAVGLAGVRRVRAGLARPTPAAVRAVGAVAVGCAVTVAWVQLVLPRPALSWALVRESVPRLLRETDRFAQQSVGVFGWLDTALPRWAYLAWWAALLGLVGLAVALGRPRGRLVLAGVVATTYAGYLAVGIVEHAIGFGMQARFVLPLLVGIPLVGAEVAAARFGEPSGPARSARRDVGRPAVVLAGAVVVAAAVVHATAVVVNLHRYAAGARAAYRWPWPGAWAPPGGRALWVAAAVAGGALVAAAGLAAARPPRHGTASGASR